MSVVHLSLLPDVTLCGKLAELDDNQDRLGLLLLEHDDNEVNDSGNSDTESEIQ